MWFGVREIRSSITKSVCHQEKVNLTKVAVSERSTFHSLSISPTEDADLKILTKRNRDTVMWNNEPTICYLF